MTWRSGGVVPWILNLGNRWRWVVSFMPLLLYTWCKNPWYSLDRTVGGLQNHSGCGGEEEKSCNCFCW